MLTVLGPAPLVFLLLFLFVARLQAGAAAGRRQPPQTWASSSDTPVVLVVFDEFDANMLMDARQRIDGPATPTWPRWRDDSTWYRNATTVNSQTTLAVPALLSGRRPTPDMLPIPADYPNNVFTLLGRQPRDARDRDRHGGLCPTRLCGERAARAAGERLRSLAKDLGIVSLHLRRSGGAGAPPAGGRPDVRQLRRRRARRGRSRTKQPDVPQSALSNRPGAVRRAADRIERQRRAARPVLPAHRAAAHPLAVPAGGPAVRQRGPGLSRPERGDVVDDPFPARLGAAASTCCRSDSSTG